MIPIMRVLARVVYNHEKFCIMDYITGNCGLGGFEPKQYHTDKWRQFFMLLCIDFKWCLIAASA